MRSPVKVLFRQSVFCRVRGVQQLTSQLLHTPHASPLSLSLSLSHTHTHTRTHTHFLSLALSVSLVRKDLSAAATAPCSSQHGSGMVCKPMLTNADSCRPMRICANQRGPVQTNVDPCRPMRTRADQCRHRIGLYMWHLSAYKPTLKPLSAPCQSNRLK